MSANERQVAGKHYKDLGVEPWDVIDTWPIEQQIGFYRGNALKYLMRMGGKDERLQEVQKGHHYVEKLIEVLSPDTEIKEQEGFMFLGDTELGPCTLSFEILKREDKKEERFGEDSPNE